MRALMLVPCVLHVMKWHLGMHQICRLLLPAAATAGREATFFDLQVSFRRLAELPAPSCPCFCPCRRHTCCAAAVTLTGGLVTCGHVPWLFPLQ